MLGQGNHRPARHAIGLLLDWMALHIGTMDVAMTVACGPAHRWRVGSM